MRKSLGIIGAGISYLITAAAAFGADQTISLTPPPGSIGPNLCLARLPQFIIQLIFIIGVIIAVIFLIYGGIRWILSGGDKSAVEAARNHIIAAIIGLIIVVGAFFIIGLIFQLLGQNNPVTQGFTIPSLGNGGTPCQ